MRAVFVLLILLGPAMAGEPVRLTTDASHKQHLQWSPDGSRFLFTRIHDGKMALWTMTAQGRDFKRLVGQDIPHFDGQWTSDGKRVYFVLDILQGTDGKLQIDRVNADGTDHANVIPHKAFDESPRLSPDGKTLLWVSTRDGNPELYTADPAGKNIKRLTSEIAFDLHPAWSPDGKRIAFSSGRTGRQKIFTMNADGTDVRKLTDGDGLDAWPVWSPDGKRIGFVSNRSGNYEIWLANADGKELKNLTNHPGSDTSPTWSPDGKRIAFVSDRSGGTEVWVLTVP